MQKFAYFGKHIKNKKEQELLSAVPVYLWFQISSSPAYCPAHYIPRKLSQSYIHHPICVCCLVFPPCYFCASDGNSSSPKRSRLVPFQCKIPANARQRLHAPIINFWNCNFISNTSLSFLKLGHRL